MNFKSKSSKFTFFHDFFFDILHISCEKGNKEIIELLLSKKSIDINSKLFYSDINKEKTALQIAVENKNKDITKLYCQIQKLILMLL